MKKSSSIKKMTMASLAVLMGSTALFNSQITTKADTGVVATTNSWTATLYTKTGQKITNRAVAPNSAWRVGKTIKINDMPYYQVSTNEYLRAGDATLNTEDKPVQKSIIVTKDSGASNLYSDLTGKKISNRALGPNSSWAVGKMIRTSNNKIFFQVSTHEYVKMQDTKYAHVFSDAIESTIFDAQDDGSPNDLNTANNTTGNTINPDSNNNQTPDTNTGSDTNTNTDPSGDVNDTVFHSSAEFNQEMLKQINELRAENGAGPLTLDSSLISFADVRANELITQFSHTRPDGVYITQVPGIASENIIKNWPTGYPNNIYEVKSAMIGLKNSPGHFKVMIDQRFTRVGFGFAYDKSTKTFYVAQDFGR